MSRTGEQGFGFRPKLMAVSVAVCFALHAPQVLSNPTGASVVSGSAGIATAGNTLTVTNSANAIINWQGFSIGINEITRFQQPSASSAVLNRVVGANGAIPQSVIDGMLSSNGRVFLLNPMGIVIGAGARIDVAGLVASTLNLSDQDFLNGTLRFTEVPGAGAVVNHGVIETASGGRVFLVAPQVENTGIIRAPQGEIVLAAGKSADLVSESSPYVSVRVVADTQQALNVGSLIADSGRIGMYGALLRNSGVAQANGASVGPGGQIRFVAAKDLTLDAGSRVSANGTSGGQVLLQAEGGTNLIAGTVEATGSAGKGGTVQALGVRVGVIGKGVIDASGETGGGTVLVGGDYQGKNSDIQNAQRTLIGPDGVIRADARTTGDGGRVIVWADGDTGFYGSISARGGSQSGNGGFVETSGKGSLQAFGRVDTSAPNGKGGTWLLDPTDIDIVAGTVSAYATCGALGLDICFNSAPVPGTSTVGVNTINNALAYGVANGQMTIEVQAKHDINFLADMVLTASGGTVRGRAGNNINLGSHNIETNGTAVEGLANNSGGPASGVGSITSNLGFGNITTKGARVILSGASVSAGNINTTGGTGNQETRVSISAGSGNVIAGNIATGDTSNGYTRIQLNASGSVTAGNLTTGNSFDGCGDGCSGKSSVEINAGSGVSVGSIQTGIADLGGKSEVLIFTSGGGVTTGNITTGSAGDDSRVEISASSGNVATGSITTGSAGDDSRVEIFASSGNVTTGPITTGSASDDSRVEISANLGNVATGPITTGSAGDDSRVEIFASSGNVTTGSITTGAAIDASNVVIEAGSGITTGPIITGDSTNKDVDLFTSSGNILTGAITTKAGSPLYYGGSVFIQTDSGKVVVNGVIDTRGANGVAGINVNGTAGGHVDILATESVLVGPPATPGINRVVINTSGGDGVGAGAFGGVAGNVFIDPQNITINGIIQAAGGSGGAGGAGGDAGSLALLTPGGNGTITFINGGFDLTGGAGSPAGHDAIPFTLVATPPTLRIEGTLIFITLLTDALANPEVAQAVGQTIKRTFGSCKPGGST